MIDILKALPNTFIPLFVAIDVLVPLSIFISMTEKMSLSERRPIIRDSVITALIVSLLFIALGKVIFGILGISSDDFKIAGGIILLIFAINDLIKHKEERRKPEGRIGVVPIGVPLIVGPAVLTTILVIVDNYGVTPTLISLIINLIIVWISFINAERIVSLFGKGGIAAISRIMSLLLAAIAIMMIRLGIENIIRQNIKV
ncbi:MAG: MarC family protein [Nitrospirota bacterium]